MSRIQQIHRIFQTFKKEKFDIEEEVGTSFSRFSILSKTDDQDLGYYNG
jgi:hypothetical protein